jgi:multiple sugar transport system permease protein
MASPPVKVATSRARTSQNSAAYLFLLPWILGVLLLTLAPMATSLYLSLTNYFLGSNPIFVGVANYQRMFTDASFQAAVRVTARYVFVSVPLQLVFALLIAVVLDKGVRGLALYRSIYYLPSLLGGSVAVAVLWRHLFASDGILSLTAADFGIEMGSWIADPRRALDTLIILNVWTFGSPMIIFLAALRQIPDELMDAAKVDGAGPIMRFFCVTIPLITPVIFFNLVLQIIGTFQSFTQAYIVSNGTGGPANSTLFYTLYLFRVGFEQFEMGYASALAWVLFVVIGIFTAINFVAARYWVHYED